MLKAAFGRTSRLGALILMAALVAIFASARVSAAVDNNLDGQVNIIDAQLVVNAILDQVTPQFPGYCDANGDDVVDVLDVQHIVNIIMGVPMPLTIASPIEMRTGFVGLPYSWRLQSYGGAHPHAWSYEGSLPPGCTFSASGVLSGVIAQQGVFSFTARVMDATGAVVSRTFILDTTSGNSAPTAVNDGYLVTPGQPLTVPAPGVLLNDSDADLDHLTAAVATAPAFGNLSLNPDGSFTYTPAANSPSTITYFYRCIDSWGAESIARVTLGIGVLSPIAEVDTFSTPRDTTLTVPAPGLLANDLDPAMNPLTAHLISHPKNGQLTLSANGAFSYIPDEGYYGLDSFKYQAINNQGGLDTSVCVIHVTATGAPEALAVQVITDTSIIQSGALLAIEAVVTNTSSSLPLVNNLTSVNLLTNVFGSPGTIGLTFDRHIDNHTAVYTLTVPANVGYGIHELIVVATDTTIGNATGTSRFAAYFGTPVRVGQGQPHTTIQSAISVCPPQGAVLIGRGTYSGVGNTNLTGYSDFIVAGESGYHVTKIDCAFQGRGFNAGGASASTIIMGLTVEKSNDGGLSLTGSVTTFQFRVRDGISEANGGAVRFTSPASPSFIECWIENNQVGNYFSPGYRYGGAIHFQGAGGLTLRDTVFINNRVLASYNASGAAVYVTGMGTIIEGSTFIGNESDAGYEAIGGAACFAGGTAVVSNSRFVSNVARSTNVFNPSESTTVYDGYEGCGGALAAISGVTLDIFNSYMLLNLAVGIATGEGGAITVEGCTQVVLDQCTLTRNKAFGVEYEGLGGAICTGFHGSFRFDHCIITHNIAEGSYEAEGGVAHSGTVGPFTQAPWYIGFHNCLIQGNTVVAPVPSHRYANFLYVDDWITGSATPVIEIFNCTVTGNTNGTSCILLEKGNATIHNTIIFGNHGTPIIKGGAGTLSILSSNIHPTLPAPFSPSTGGNMSLDPLFASHTLHGNFFLSQLPLQLSASPCVNSGTAGLGTSLLSTFTTATNLSPDSGLVDMGWHRIPPSLPIIPRAGQTAAQLRLAFPCSGPALPTATPSSSSSSPVPNESNSGGNPGPTPSSSDAPSPTPPCGCGSNRDN